MPNNVQDPRPIKRGLPPMKIPTPSTEGFSEEQSGAAAPGHTLEIPMRLFSNTIRKTRKAMAGLAPGEVMRVLTNDP